MSKEAQEMLMGGGGTSAKWPTIGTKYVGKLIAMEKRQQTTIKGDKEFWSDGEPKWQVVFTIDTGEIDPGIEDDDGIRNIYSKPNMLQAVRDAVRKSGHKGDLVGGRLGVKYAGDGEPSQPGFNGPKQFTAIYEPPSEADMLADEEVNRDPLVEDVDDLDEYDGSPF